MNSKKIPLYNILGIAAITLLLIGFIFITRDLKYGTLFGPGIIGFAILFNPFYLAWVIISLLSFFGSIFLVSERAIRSLNIFLLILPLILFTLFAIIFI